MGNTSVEHLTNTPPGGISVHDLPRLLGNDLLATVVPCADENARIRSLCLFDEHSTERAELMLAIAPGTGDWSRVIGLAAHRGACAVITDPLPDDILPEIRRAASRAGLALLERSSDTAWLTLADLIRDLIAHTQSDDIRASGVAVDDLEGLAESLAEMLGGPVIIEDAKFRLLSYSSSTEHVDRGRDIAILGRRIPEEWLRHLESLGVIDTLLGTDEVVTVDDGPLEARRRLLRSIRAERFLLGILWVAEGDTPLPADVHERMAVAARTAAPFLLRHQEASFSRRSAQDRQMRHLLDQGSISHAAAEEYGLVPASQYTVLGLRTSPDSLISNLDRNRIVESVGMYCQSYRRRAATTTLGHTVYCLLAHAEPATDTRLKEFARAMGGHVSQALLGRGVRVALSRTVDTLQDMPTARQQVDQALESAVVSDVVTVTGFDDALPRIALARIAQFVEESRIDYPKLHALYTEDRSSGSEYIATLAAYLSAFGNVVLAAKQLSVHVTTLRYRLKRIQAISGLNLDDPAERLLCELLLQEPVSRVSGRVRGTVE
ncbi:PucR family transcriptional regulator [Mycobacterium sp. NPDC003449]